jgi:hypothetical protein
VCPSEKISPQKQKKNIEKKKKETQNIFRELLAF